MKRKALIIASDDKELPGVYKDIENYKNFLLGIAGGAWHENEIFLCQGMSKKCVLRTIREIKNQHNDFVIAIFSGHGEDVDGITKVQLNNKNECITQAEIENLGNRQISIYDCCRKEASVRRKIAMDAKVLFESSSSVTFLKKNEARRIYEKYIMGANWQQVVLYSCNNNEYSNDTKDGGLYSLNFIREAQDYNGNLNESKTAISVHNSAAEKVTQENKNQNPTYSMPRVLNKLIISINPRRLTHLKSLYT